MKNKILFGIGVLAVAAVLTLNLNLARNNSTVKISVATLQTALADDAECTLCKIVYGGEVKFSCKFDPTASCSKSQYGFTVSCTNAKECTD